MEAEQVRTHVRRALVELAAGTDSIQARLSGAWVELMPLTKQDLPASLQEPFSLIEAEMLAAPEDADELSDDVASAAAERVVLLAIAFWGPSG